MIEFERVARERGLVEPIAMGSTIAMPRIVERQRLVHEYAWAIPNEEALQAIASEGPVLEIGAGNGYWCSLLKERGADILAFDPNPYELGQVADLGAVMGIVERKRWGPVERGDHTIVAEHRDRNLLICWPGYGEPWAREALELTRAETVFYVGEMGGCTADDEFHMQLMLDFKLCERIDIPRFYPVHDFLGVWRR